MKIVFLKDHVNYKAGDVVENHPNTNYLLRCGVVEMAPIVIAPKVVVSPKPVLKNGKL